MRCASTLEIFEGAFECPLELQERIWVLYSAANLRQSILGDFLGAVTLMLLERLLTMATTFSTPQKKVRQKNRRRLVVSKFSIHLQSGFLVPFKGN